MDKWEVRRDLTGIVLTASSAHDPPYVDIGEVDPLNLPPGYKVGTRLAEIKSIVIVILVKLNIRPVSNIYQIKLLR